MNSVLSLEIKMQVLLEDARRCAAGERPLRMMDVSRVY